MENTAKYSKARIGFSLASATFSPLTYGISLTLTDLLSEAIQKTYQLEKSSISKNMNVLIFAGAFISNIFGSLSSFERTKLISISAAFYGVGFCFLLSTQLAFLYAGRVLQGIAAGLGASTVPFYLGSIAPIAYRGAISSLYPLGIVLGLLIGTSLCLLKENYLLILLILSTLAVSHAMITFMTIKLYAPKVNDNSSLFSLLKNRKAHRSLILMLIFHTAQCFSGVNHILFNSHTIFSGSNNTLMMIYLLSFALLITLISSSVVDKFGRKLMILISSLIVTGSNLAFYYALYPKVFAFVHILGFNLGLSSIPFILIGEIFPVANISQGGLFGTSCNFLGNMLSLFVDVGGTEAYNKAFMVYVRVLVAFCVVVLLLYKETKGRVPEFQ